MPTPDELLAHLDRVYTLALRLAGNPADAWDLAQDAMLKALKGLPAFRGDAALDTWLFRITVNAWKNRNASASWRWWERRVSLDPLGEEGSVPKLAEPGPEGALEADESRRALEAALAALAPEDRAALVLRELENKSYQEIVEILGIPMGTVKSRLHRARLELARALEPRS
ncbi:MAG TPA: sigma-70 family RNA polymerase sigma factor [Elusimicrobiota bacterium]|nr:sigma-70 family RNA polymerase sigma factor [Elusimicrobiota bacterium]